MAVEVSTHPRLPNLISADRRIELVNIELEKALHNWRDQFSPGVAGPQPVKVQVEVEKTEPKKTAAKKPTAKKTAPKSTAKKAAPKKTTRKATAKKAAGRGRAKGKMSLAQAIAKVLSESKDRMAPKEIRAAVIKQKLIPNISKSFVQQVANTLSRGDQFKRSKDGTYSV